MLLYFSSRMYGRKKHRKKNRKVILSPIAHLQWTLRSCQSHTWNCSQILSFTFLSSMTWICKHLLKIRKLPVSILSPSSSLAPNPRDYEFNTLVSARKGKMGMHIALLSPKQAEKFRWSPLEMQRNENQKMTDGHFYSNSS